MNSLLTGENLNPDPPVSIPFGNIEAKQFIGRTASGAIELAITGALIKKHTISLVLSCNGDPITDDDLKVFRRIFADAQITVDGLPYRRTPTQTAPQTTP